ECQVRARTHDVCRALPHLVRRAAPEQAVGGRRAAGDGGAAQHEGAELQQRVELELVGVGIAALWYRPAAAQRDRVVLQLRDALASALAATPGPAVALTASPTPAVASTYVRNPNARRRIPLATPTITASATTGMSSRLTPSVGGWMRKSPVGQTPSTSSRLM